MPDCVTPWHGQVYIFNRDASANLTISSPLEAHKANTIHFSIVAVDVGFDNPVFACIELDYTEADADPTVRAAAAAAARPICSALLSLLSHLLRLAVPPFVARACHQSIRVLVHNIHYIINTNDIIYYRLRLCPRITCPHSAFSRYPDSPASAGLLMGVGDEGLCVAWGRAGRESRRVPADGDNY